MSGRTYILRHIPYVGVTRGSSGDGGNGRLHLHVHDALHSGRLHRRASDALCNRNTPFDAVAPSRPWEALVPRCTTCVRLAARHGLEWPSLDVS